MAAGGIRTVLLDRAKGLGPERQVLLHPGWRRHVVPAGVAVFMLALFVYSLNRFGFSFARIWNGLEQLGFIVYFMMPPNAEGQFFSFAKAVAETVAIALLGTLLGALLAFPLSMLAARNVMTNRLVQFMSRRTFDAIRGIDTLIWALIYVNVVGLGPFAGVLAIASSDMAGFAKTFSEAMEATEKNASEGVRSTGGRRSDEFAFGLLPQVMPVLISQVLYFFESNTRSATIIGIVGAGGIGLFLSDTIRTGEWQQVSVIILMILFVVSMIDLISTRLRFAIIGKRE